MVSKNSYEGIDKYTAALIKTKAHQLIGKAGFTEADRRDLEQELMLDLLKRMKHFDPTKAKRNTFMSRVVEHRVVTLIEEQLYQCRDYRCRGASLNRSVTIGEDVLGEMLDLLTYDGMNANHDGETTERLNQELQIDLQRAIETLPPELQNLCDRLRKNTMSEIAQELGIKRTTLYERLKLLRQWLAEAGF